MSFERDACSDIQAHQAVVQYPMRYIVISGNIGAGKSTLAGKLAELPGWNAFYETQHKNPYLEDFYRDMGAWAFRSQLYFLTDRLRLYTQLGEGEGIIVGDRSIYEDAEIFAKHLHAQGFIDKRDYGLYTAMYNQLCSLLPPPELVVYLAADIPTLKSHIALRGRGYERDIDDEYLRDLNGLYEKWIRSYTYSEVLTIHAGSIDIVHNPEDLDRVIELIRDAVKDKQEMLFEDY